MANLEVIRGFIAQVLADTDHFDGPVGRDDDGDFRVRRGSAEYWVAAVQTADGAAVVQVGSAVLREVPLSKKALRAANAINAEYLWVRAVWRDDAVVISREIPAELVTGAVLVQACDFIGSIADAKDDELKALLAVGASAYADDAEEDDAVAV
jgi:Putative bacterial sensory transduction regulator